MVQIFDHVAGSGPLLVSIPHAGTKLPAALSAGLTLQGRALPDTDWYVDELYQFAVDWSEVSVLRANYSRYVVDLNRPADDTELYPGRVKTGLFPLATFAGDPIYQPGAEPDRAERQDRLLRYWQPYHDALANALDQLRERHGFALLWDAHSIASEVPALFEGRLPDFNFGTANGDACAPELLNAVVRSARQQGLKVVCNERFQGGHITRHFGCPARGCHAIQLELSQRCYLNESTRQVNTTAFPAAVTSIRKLLISLLEATEDFQFSA